MKVPGIWLAATVAALGAPPEVSFRRNIAPLLTQRCLACHKADQPMAGLRLTSRAAILKGGQHGPALVPGDAAASRLYRRVAGLEQPAMPLGGRLSDAEIAALKSWIDAGAGWEGPELSRSAGPGRDWWAFRKPVRPAVPAGAKHPIDAFVAAARRAAGLTAAPPAEPAVLVRRAWLDLTGLLPPPEEVEGFERDPSPQAWEALLDRLLDSPHYGERWARHWLDVARYADSWGHIHDDDNPNAWRYRDYVIRSLNEDKPYNQFILEQLAGDELDEVTYDALIATGFSRIGPRVLFREKQNPHYRYDYLDDLIGTTSRAFLGLTVSCARCHDHKFDPIPQADYFRLMRVFFPFVDYNHPLETREKIAADEALKGELEAQMKPLRAEIRRIEEPYRRALFERKLRGFPEDVQAAVHTPEDQRTPGQKLLAAQVLSVSLGGRRELDLSPADREAIRKLEAQLREIEKRLPKPLPVAAGIRDGDYRFTPDGPGDEPVPGTTAKRFQPDFAGSFIPEPGKPYAPPPLATVDGKPIDVEPGFLTALTEGRPRTEHPPADGRPTSGRRRALAEWIASAENPLTARVIVNRVWHHHFGRGIVATPSNFGHTGSPPTHPELLDWLATEFVREGWSLKRLHRLILTSETYRMASAWGPAANLQQDPDDQYLWRFPMHRLEAEALRDIILSASGKLNPQAGGPPFFPAIPAAVQDDAKKVGKWVLTREEPATWRRSIYAYWKRALKYPLFEVFDQPDTMATCERRNITTAPTQALTLLNNEFVLLQAQHFAERVRQAAGGDPAAQVRLAWRIALSREPAPAELERNLEFLRRQTLAELCHVILNLNEFAYVN